MSINHNNSIFVFIDSWLMKKSFLFFIFCYFSFALNAQVPGYLGKRFSLSYQNFFFASITGTETKSKINISHNAELNFLTGKRSALCFTFMYVPFKVSTYYNAGNYTQIIFSEDVPYLKCNSFSYTLGLKLFINRKKFAPLGLYFKWELEYSKGSIKIPAYTKKLSNGSYWNPVVTSTQYPEQTIIVDGGGPAISFGKQRVFFDKLLVDYGIRAGIIVVWNSKKSYADRGFENTMIDKVQNNVLAQQFFNFKIGIGFLPF